MSDNRSAAVHRSSSSLPGVQPARQSSSSNVVSMMPFLALARELSGLIVPVHPRDGFRDGLGRSLVIAARQQYARERLMSSPLPLDQSAKISRRWALGAATVGSAVSLVGIMALVAYRRRHQAA